MVSSRHIMFPTTLLLSLLAGTATAFPHLQYRNSTSGEDYLPYQAPHPTDARGPCPALNTLANHGYLNHDGRDLNRDDITNAFLDGLGIGSSIIQTPLENAFTVCEYVTGQTCGDTLVNLTVLAEPHAFEHDHSFSRQDYKMGYLASEDEFVDNHNFNLSIFESALAPFSDLTHMDYANANEFRLLRESDAMVADYPGWFTQAIPTQEFEFGFIYALVSDFDLPGYSEGEPAIRIDWWKYWFVNESLPTPLGWHKPNPPKEIDFVTSASSRILAAGVAWTPTPLPSGALSPSAAAAAPLPTADTTTVYPLALNTPYVGPIGDACQEKRAVVDAPRAHAPQTDGRPAQTLNARMAVETSNSAPPLKNPYMESIDVDYIAARHAWASSQLSSMKARAAPTASPS